VTISAVARNRPRRLDAKSNSPVLMYLDSVDELDSAPAGRAAPLVQIGGFGPKSSGYDV